MFVSVSLKDYPAGRYDLAAQRTATTNAQGNAVITNLYFGENVATVSKTDYSSATATVNISGTAAVPVAFTLTRDTGSVDVFVRDEKGNMLPGAAVTMTAGGASQTQTSGANGIAGFTTLPVGGPYTFSASLAGYGSGTSAAVTVNKTVKQTPVVTLTRKTVGATVIVTDGTNPLAGAGVIISAPGVTSVLTAADGKAAFSSITPGQYNVNAWKDNYGSNSGSITVTLDGTGVATVVLTRATGGVDIYVRDNNSAIIPGATVTTTGNGSNMTATTDGNGKAGFSNLITGNWSFTVTKPGYNPGNVTVNIQSSPRQSPTVIITKESGNATFTVTDGANPLADAKVLLQNLNGLSISHQTDASGKTTFTGLAPGPYVATASKFGYSDSARTNLTVAVNDTAATTLTVARQQTPAGSQYITVTNALGDPVSGVTVTLAGDAVTKTQTTGVDGKATFTGLIVGSYIVTAEKEGYISFTKHPIPGDNFRRLLPDKAAPVNAAGSLESSP